jgi:hypothetical protein
MRVEKYFIINNQNQNNDFYSLFHLDIQNLLTFDFDKLIEKDLELFKKTELLDEFGNTFIDSYKTKEHYHLIDVRYGNYQFKDGRTSNDKGYHIFLDKFEFDMFDTISINKSNDKITKIEFIGHYRDINGVLFFTEYINSTKIQALVRKLIQFFGKDDYQKLDLSDEEILEIDTEHIGFYRHWIKEQKIRLELYSYGLVLSKYI